MSELLSDHMYNFVILLQEVHDRSYTKGGIGSETVTHLFVCLFILFYRFVFQRFKKNPKKEFLCHCVHGEALCLFSVSSHRNDALDCHQ